LIELMRGARRLLPFVRLLRGQSQQWQTVQKLSPNVSVMLIPCDQGFLFNIPMPSATP
jgi:hypothetical protein